MINRFGKALALLQAAFSIALAALALALYFNAVDFGWKQPERYWRDQPAKKGQNMLVPSLFDRREAALRQTVRVRRDELAKVAQAKQDFSQIEMILGENFLEGAAVLKNLQEGSDKMEIRTVKFDENGNMLVKAGSHPSLGFPALETPVLGIEYSYREYLKNLVDLGKKIESLQSETATLLNQEQAVTDRLLGEADKDGNPVRDKAGNAIKPGWHYLIETEMQMQRELQKELEHVDPLWLKELVDVHQVKSRRDSLVERLNELVGQTGYMSESEFMRKK